MNLREILRPLAILGNVMYILWIFYNAVDEGPKGIGPVQAVALSGLIVLLVLNIFLLSRRQ